MRGSFEVEETGKEDAARGGAKGTPHFSHVLAVRLTLSAFLQLTIPRRANRQPTDEAKLLERITVNPNIFGGKPIIRGRRLAVEHVLGMLAAGDSPEILLQGYPWLEKEDVQACLVHARRLVGPERIEPLKIEAAA